MSANGNPDWSADFFNVGNLPYNEETEAYTVEDVDYCIEMATDWRDRAGDFQDDDPNEERHVIVQERS